MGEVLAAIGTFEKAKQAHDAMTGPDPGLAPMDVSIPALPGQDAAQAQPVQMQGIQPPQGSNLGAMFAQADVPQAPAPEQPQEAPPAETPNNPYAPTTPEEIAASIGTPDRNIPAQSDNAPIEVQGDGWKPHKESVLGQIGDFFLMRRGMQPLFKETNDRHNLTEALQGYNKDPETSISRVRKFNPDLALKMQQQYEQTHKSDAYYHALTEEHTAKTNDIYRGQLGSMIGAVMDSKNPEQSWNALSGVMSGYAQAHGIEDFPTKYDPDRINAFRQSAVKVKDQISQSERERHNKSMEGVSQQRADQANAAAQARIKISQQRADQAHSEAMARIRKTSKTGTVSGVVHDSQGNPLPFVTNKDRNVMKVKGPDGKYHKYVNAGTQDGHTTWVPFDEAPDE